MIEPKELTFKEMVEKYYGTEMYFGACDAIGSTLYGFSHGLFIRLLHAGDLRNALRLSIDEGRKFVLGEEELCVSDNYVHFLAMTGFASAGEGVAYVSNTDKGKIVERWINGVTQNFDKEQQAIKDFIENDLEALRERFSNPAKNESQESLSLKNES